MNNRIDFILGSLLVCLFLSNFGWSDDTALHNWGQWRGPLSRGVAPHAKPPTRWSEVENVAWKTDLPGLGHSTPVAWGDRIFLTTAIPIGEKLPPRYSGAPGAHDNAPITQRQSFVGLCVDRATGKIVWQRALHEALPHEGAHFSASLASASPVTDGQHIYFFFGSYGLYCLDYEGNTVWSKQLGTQNTKHGHGEGSSPVLHNNSLVINWDHEGQSFTVALDAKSGDEKWKVERDEVTSWASPIVVAHDGQDQLIVSGTDRVRSYDLKDGSEIWECGGLSANIVASPVAADGMVFAGSSYEIRAMLAIRLKGAQGDLTGTDQVVWTRIRSTPYVPSPLLYQGSLYYLRHYQGILTRLDARTGAEKNGPFRLGPIRDIYASPVAADGRLYFSDLDGTTLVISTDETPEVLAINRLDDSFSASPCLIGNEIILRGNRRLYCLKNNNQE